jgi:hypothetical protein
VLAVRPAGLIALSLDARSALTAVHARTIAYGRTVQLGEDVVVFVGGPFGEEARAAFALPPEGSGWALLPGPKDIRQFGVAAVLIDEPPRLDEPVIWSIYPNGLEPAPIAVAPGAGRLWTVRARPHGPDPASPIDIETGYLSVDGSFVSLDAFAATGRVQELAIAIDAQSALWVAWLDASGSWVQRSRCR